MMNATSSCTADTKRGAVYVRSSCDRHLLEAAHHRISVGAVVAVLKAFLMLGMSTNTLYCGFYGCASNSNILYIQSVITEFRYAVCKYLS
jgi:hypothetical protein